MLFKAGDLEFEEQLKPKWFVIKSIALKKKRLRMETYISLEEFKVFSVDQIWSG